MMDTFRHICMSIILYTTSKKSLLKLVGNINHKDIYLGLKDPVAYKSYACVSIRNHIPPKVYVFLENTVLHT